MSLHQPLQEFSCISEERFPRTLPSWEMRCWLLKSEYGRRPCWLASRETFPRKSPGKRVVDRWKLNRQVTVLQARFSKSFHMNIFLELFQKQTVIFKGFSVYMLLLLLHLFYLNISSLLSSISYISSSSNFIFTIISNQIWVCLHLFWIITG
jgi:hypothetical protein